MKSENIILFIAAFAALSALLSAGFTYYSASSFKEGIITGLASQTNGTVNITVNTLLSINFTNNTINWGGGTFNAGSTRANLTTAQGGTVSAVGGTWSIAIESNGSGGFIIENVGNVNATLHVATGKSAATFLGGTTPAYMFNVTNSDAGSCLNNTGGIGNITNSASGGLIPLGYFYDVNTTIPGTPICGRFQFTDSSDSIRIGVHLSIPYDGINGTLTDAFTVLYCQAPGPCT